MPSGDGTGPGGSSRGTGTGRRSGKGRGGGSGLGPGGLCVCLKCGEKISHQSGIPCFETRCPKCGGTMTRE
ncbi:hypothetical protein KJ966_02265 [bacterium]|nr:hypothetical protein [bacterium]